MRRGKDDGSKQSHRKGMKKTFYGMQQSQVATCTKHARVARTQHARPESVLITLPNGYELIVLNRDTKRFVSSDDSGGEYSAIGRRIIICKRLSRTGFNWGDSKT